jgi:hypothetical protein
MKRGQFGRVSFKGMDLEVPHSGNECSGLCLAPCLHDGCWQCKEFGEKHPADLKRAMAMKFEEDKRKARKGIGQLAKMPPAKPGWSILPPGEYARVERSILEEILKRGEMSMDWNKGDPIFYRDEAPKRDLRETLADIAKEAQKRDEEIAIAKMKAEGATDADIEAAKALGAWNPPKEGEAIIELQSWLTSKMARDTMMQPAEFAKHWYGTTSMVNIGDALAKSAEKTIDDHIKKLLWGDVSEKL